MCLRPKMKLITGPNGRMSATATQTALAPLYLTAPATRDIKESRKQHRKVDDAGSRSIARWPGGLLTRRLETPTAGNRQLVFASFFRPFNATVRFEAPYHQPYSLYTSFSY